jgi:membrane protein DedA with SNARE-associated domain/membrane-associated phospholipid phosphatase
MTAWVQGLVDLLAQNPSLAGVIIFFVAMTEALFVIGLVIPSTVVLVGAGTLVGLGKLQFWPVFLLTVLGAVAGDAISYWFGHVYKGHIKSMWPFSRYPEAIAKGEIFFGKHGGKSVFIGRFVPGVKAVVPGIAGMMGMDAWHFTLINVTSAFAWAAAHLFPAMLAGAALTVLGTISTRLMVAGIILLALILFIALAARWFTGWLAPHLTGFRQSLVVRASRRGGKFADWIAATLDPSHPHATEMLISAGALLIALPLFFLLLSEIGPNEQMVLSDAAISNFMGSLRTMATDRVMIFFTLLGDTQVTLPVALAAGTWLAWQRAWHPLVGLAIATSSAVLFVPLMKNAMQRTRPIDLYAGVDSFSFPSGHATINAVFYGIIAYLIAQELPKWGKVLIYSIFAFLVAMICLSRIYLGAHWPSDVAGGLLFAAAVAACYALFTGGRSHEIGSLKFAALTMGVFLVAASVNVRQGFDQAVVSYAPNLVITTIDGAAWESGLWKNLPARRIDLVGETEEPMTLQWSGTANAIGKELASRGWSPAVPVGLMSLGNMLTSQIDPRQLPTLPSLNDGNSPSITMTKLGPSPNTPERLVLRLWPTMKRVAGGSADSRIFIGSIVKERIVSLRGGVSLPKIDENFTPDILLLQSLAPLGGIVERPGDIATASRILPVLVARSR